MQDVVASLKAVNFTFQNIVLNSKFEVFFFTFILHEYFKKLNKIQFFERFSLNMTTVNLIGDSESTYSVDYSAFRKTR